MSDEAEKYRSAFGKVLYKYFLEREGKKIITQKTLAERSRVDQTVISRMVSQNSKFAKGQTLYDDLYAIFKALAEMPEMEDDISVEKAERLIQKIPDDNLSLALKRKLVFTLTNEKIIKPMYTTLQGLPLIGRDDDIVDILTILQKDTKLLPLVGPPGVGKSELAYQVAVEGKRVRLFSSVKIINLESKTSTEEALEEIYKELQGTTQKRPMLLILDNVEHLPGIVELLHKNILINQEGLSILATSHVSITTSEKEVNPLEVPPTATLRSPLFNFIVPIPPEELQTYDAVQLFLEAVNVNKKADKKLRITEKNAEAIAAICIGLDGLPMPLIMAASWIDELTPQGVYDLLTEGKILNEAYEYDDHTEHRQSIGKLVAWSFNRLQLPAQKILRRLALFDGPCSETAILAICTVDDDDLPKEAGELRAILRKLKSHRLIFYANQFAHITHNTVHAFAEEMLIKEEKEKDVKKFLRLVTNFANYYHRLLAEAITKKQMKKEPERILEIYSLLFHKEERNFRLALSIMRDIQEHIVNTEMAKAGIDLKSDLANPSIKRADVARKYSNIVVELEEAGKIPYLHSNEILTNVVVGKVIFSQINLKDRFWLKDANMECAQPHDRTVTIFEDREIDTLGLLLDEDEPDIFPTPPQLLED